MTEDGGDDMVPARSMERRLFFSFLSLLLVVAAPNPSNPRLDPDVCKLLTDLDLEPVLFAGTGGTLDSELALSDATRVYLVVVRPIGERMAVSGSRWYGKLQVLRPSHT